MATPLDVVERPAADATKPSRNLVEMNWDPITRIVGSLGIYTKSTSRTAASRNVTARPRFFAATASL
jgi:hypothetical protein